MLVRPFIGTATSLAYLPATVVTAGTTLVFSLGSSARHRVGFGRRRRPAVVRRDTGYWR